MTRRPRCEPPLSGRSPSRRPARSGSQTAAPTSSAWRLPPSRATSLWKPFAAAPPGARSIVAAPVGGRLLEGFVDLCFDDGAGLVVVDYKTDAVDGDEDLERAYERYRLQAAAYALALAAATGRPVQRCVLLFLAAPGRPGGAGRHRSAHALGGGALASCSRPAR